jgi:tetratricopeptide (TPR) repeat protein
MLAMVLDAQNKKSEARRQYELILGIDPNAVVAANNLAWMLVESERNPDAALPLAQRAKQILPGDPRVNDTLGWVYVRKDLTEQAIPLLEEAVRSDQDNAVHQFHLGIAYVRAGDWAKARAPLRKALELQPGFSGAGEARTALEMIGR